MSRPLGFLARELQVQHMLPDPATVHQPNRSLRSRVFRLACTPQQAHDHNVRAHLGGKEGRWNTQRSKNGWPNEGAASICGEGHGTVTIHREGRTAELLLVGARHKLEPRSVRRVCEALGLKWSDLPDRRAAPNAASQAPKKTELTRKIRCAETGDSVVQIDKPERVFTSNNKDAMYKGVDCFGGA